MKGDVYVKFDPAGRMGNRMFQYAFGYLLAKARGCKFYHEELPNFNIPRLVKNPESPAINTRQLGNQKVNLKYLIDADENIIVDSFVQRSEYYVHHKDELKELFNIKDLPVINKGKLVMHIRETDYVQIGCFLGLKEYLNLIERSGFSCSDTIIVTDNSYCSTVAELTKLGCKVNTEGYVDKFTHCADDRGMQDFNTLLYSENIAVSHSSFSWWPAFLGNHKMILFPDASGMWKNDNDDCINLIL